MKQEPYLIETVVTTVRKYNPDFGDDLVCRCGHAYYRHFDTYEEMEACGCKYCDCFEFKLPTTYAIHDRYFRYDETNELQLSGGSAAPNWLGKFRLKQTLRNKAPKKFENIIRKMEALVPDQRFNSVFFQTYTPGDSVNKHRDPKNNVGKTIIAIFGSFDGGYTTIHDDDGTSFQFKLQDGDVLVLDCTIDGKQGPLHEVSEITSGCRYAIILNTIDGMEYGEKIDNLMEELIKTNKVIE